MPCWTIWRIAVSDVRQTALAEIAKSAVIISNQMEFVDIAGQVRGASKGEGLGNKFLAHIREVDAVMYVLRCFIDDDITHVEGSVDPLRDAEIIELELTIADLESLEKRVENNVKKAKGGDKDAQSLVSLAEPILALLREGKPARAYKPADRDEAKRVRGLQLLTS